MMRRDEYTSKINRFSKGISKMLIEDFPENSEIRDKVDDYIAAIQFEILGAILKKGVIK